MNIEGARVVDGRVVGGVPMASMEGGEGERGGQEQKRQVPWLLDMGNRVSSNLFFSFIIFC